MPIDIQTILVATDFSEASELATTYAFRLASALRARLYLLHVVPEDDLRLITSISQHLQSSITPIALTDVFYTEAHKRLTQLIAEAQASAVVHERLVVTGQPAEAILSWAVAKQGQLIILGTHGHRGLNRFLMGSVAERVVRQARCAVIVVPGEKIRFPTPSLSESAKRLAL